MPNPKDGYYDGSPPVPMPGGGYTAESMALANQASHQALGREGEVMTWLAQGDEVCELEKAVSERRAVEVLKYDGPPLIILYPRPMKFSVLERLRADLDRAMNSGTCKVAVIDEGAKVFQLINGRWQALN